MRRAVYWDASAVLSLLTTDSNSRNADEWYRSDSVHLLSTLSYSESCAVLGRLRREGIITETESVEAIGRLQCRPWNLLTRCPGWDDIAEAAIRFDLRGADLWHLAMASTLMHRLPELVMLTYDNKLRAAAKAAGFAAPADVE